MKRLIADFVRAVMGDTLLEQMDTLRPSVTMTERGSEG